MNWREPETYSYTETLDARQWAWEFMRRNTDYQQDYAWFIKTWNTLEQRYGRPPQRIIIAGSKTHWHGAAHYPTATTVTTMMPVSPRANACK